MPKAKNKMINSIYTLKYNGYGKLSYNEVTAQTKAIYEARRLEY